MKILISGSSSGIGKATAETFLSLGHEVYGIDLVDAPFVHERYTHFIADVRGTLPSVDGVEILITCAGIQFPEEDVLDVNLKGTVAVVEKYAFQKSIRSVLTVASASGINGAEFPLYAASKGGVIAYTKNLALRLAEYHATANSISPGGVLTTSNAPVLDDPKLKDAVMKETLLNKWATPEEIADWIYFLTVVNQSMTGENVLVDNGEMLKSNFIWPKEK